MKFASPIGESRQRRARRETTGEAKRSPQRLINAYEKSLNDKGTGDLQYIEGATFIHPNEKGIDLISQEIADYLFNSKILPN